MRTVLHPLRLCVAVDARAHLSAVQLLRLRECHRLLLQVRFVHLSLMLENPIVERPECSRIAIPDAMRSLCSRYGPLVNCGNGKVLKHDSHVGVLLRKIVSDRLCEGAAVWTLKVAEHNNRHLRIGGSVRWSIRRQMP